MVNEKNFCIGPWSEVRILPDGRLNWCHYASPATSTDYIQNIDLDSYFNGNNVKKIRDKILAGRDVSECQRCYNDENKIIYSYRRRRNVQMAIFPFEHFKKSLAESTIQKRFNDPDIKPYFYNIVLGNLCNLACVMCDPYYSSRLSTDFKRIDLISTDQPSLVDWTQDDASWNKFIDHIDNNKNIVCVHFQGGEPLLHSKFQEFLKHCVETNHTDFHLTMVTNGTVFDKELIELFNQFKSCQIDISIETITAVNQYIRHPVNQDQLINNIKKFLNCRNEKISVVLRTVPQLLSVLDYVSILEFCLEYSICIDTNPIERPEYLKPAVWPKNIRELALERLEQFKSKLNVDNSLYNLNLRNQHQVKMNLKQNADIVIGLLNENIANRCELQKQAQDYFKKIDSLRKLQITDYCPEFATING